MLEKLLNFKFHLRFVFNPYIRYKSNNLGSAQCVNRIKRNVPLIISITSYEERFDDLELSLYTILNQSVLPDKIILWLSDKYNTVNDLPYSITKYIKNGLEIKFVKDIGPYTKIIYALKEYPNAIIVTADDDILYPKDWLKKLYHSYIAYPNDVHVHRAHRVLSENGVILPYEKWKKHVEEESARFDNFITGVGGALYPPGCFCSEVFRKDVFLKQAPKADDIWLWIMALLSGRKIRVVGEHIKMLCCTDFFGQIGLKNKKTLYRQNRRGLNDKQLNSLLKYYGKNISSKL